MGKLNIIIGPMYSGKTTELLSRYFRYKVAGKKCLLIKYEKDKRYENDKIVTHNLFKQDANSCINLKEYDNEVNKYDVILIDEIQFYSDAHIYCDKWANQDLIVETSGLNGDYIRKPFEQVSLLIPLSDKITHLTAVDKKDGDDASFTARLSCDDKQTVIGGEDIYQSMNRKNHCEHLKNQKIKQAHL